MRFAWRDSPQGTIRLRVPTEDLIKVGNIREPKTKKINRETTPAGKQHPTGLFKLDSDCGRLLLIRVEPSSDGERKTVLPRDALSASLRRVAIQHVDPATHRLMPHATWEYPKYSKNIPEYVLCFGVIYIYLFIYIYILGVISYWCIYVYIYIYSKFCIGQDMDHESLYCM